MASAPQSKAAEGHPLTRSLVPRTTAPPTSHTRQSSQNHPAHATSEVTDSSENEAIDSALTASSKTGESLTALLKALGEFQGDLSGAKNAQERLQVELVHIRELLGRTNEERLRLKNRVATLEEEIRERGDVSQLDARYVQEEQDRFIAALIDEYEETITKITAEREQAMAGLGAGIAPVSPHATIPSPAPDRAFDEELEQARLQIKKLVGEREKTRQLIQRAQTQRDQAQAKAERLEKELAEALSRAPKHDQHTRPTDAPPGSAQGAKGSQAITERPAAPAVHPPRVEKTRARQPNLGQKSSRTPRSRELQLSELEQEWDRTTTPAPPPSYETALDEKTKTPGSLRHQSPPAELRAALTSPVSKDPVQAPAASSSLPRVIAKGTKPSRSARKGIYASPTLPKMTPPLEQVTTSSPPASRASQPPNTMSYPADKKPPLKRKPDPLKRPLVGYSKSSGEVREEHFRGRPSGTPRTRS